MSNQYTWDPPCTKKELMEAYITEGLSQVECAKRFGCSQKVIWHTMLKYGIKARKMAKRNQYGRNNHMWKAKEAGRQAFHRRLYSRFGKPTKCSVCGTEDPSKSYDYANLTGNYDDCFDYAPMCRSCHWVYDERIDNIKAMRERRVSECNS